MYKTKKLHIYFGDATDGISKQLHCIPITAKLVDVEPFKSVTQKIGVPRLSVLNQTHGTQGIVISDLDSAFTLDGDYLITNQSHVGLGVLTADCVPLVLYDEKNHAVGIVHAGWKGAVADVALKSFEHMKSVWNSDPDNMQLFVGPSAKACCYQVQEDFAQYVPSVHFDKVMSKKNGSWYFDTVQLIQLQVQELKIDSKHIHSEFNFCTICDHRFFSYRRQGLNAGRQITIAVLK